MSVIEQTYDKSKYDSFKQMELLINDLAYLEGIYGAMLFRMDALLIHLKISVDFTQELIEVIIWLKNIIEKVSIELQEDIEGISYAKENFSVYFYKVGNAGILSVIVDSYANKGLLSIEMDKVATLVKDLIIVKF